MVEPVSTTIAAVSFAKNASELTNKLYEFAKKYQNREMHQELDALIDALRELKRQAGVIEDENRDLREQLRFKSNDYVFDNPFWYRNSDATKTTPLCPKCFGDNREGHMSIPQGEGAYYRLCLVCGKNCDIPGRKPQASSSESQYNPYGDEGWMSR